MIKCGNGDDDNELLKRELVNEHKENIMLVVESWNLLARFCLSFTANNLTLFLLPPRIHQRVCEREGEGEGGGRQTYSLVRQFIHPPSHLPTYLPTHTHTHKHHQALWPHRLLA